MASVHLERVEICGDGPWKVDVSAETSTFWEPCIVAAVGRDREIGRGTEVRTLIASEWEKGFDEFVGKLFKHVMTFLGPVEPGDREAVEAALRRAMPRSVSEWLTEHARRYHRYLDSSEAMVAWALAEAEHVLES